MIILAQGVYSYINQARTPVAIIQAYYDALDFRRFSEAYAYLDPNTRPTYDQYLLKLSVSGGMVASYGKLDSVFATVISSEKDHVTIEARTLWVTSLAEYPTVQRHNMVLRDGEWKIVPVPAKLEIPPDQFLRQPQITYFSQGRRRVTTDTTAFADVLDRPELQIISARLVKVGERYYVVGELMNVSNDPADVTVTALLYGHDNSILTQYNAQEGMIHKLLPKEVTPFRVDFEGVAGAVLSDRATAGEFRPDAYSPIQLDQPVANFEVYAKAVVTQYDLDRSLATQDISVGPSPTGQLELHGQLVANGTQEATIPHVLVTFYDANNSVVWVDHAYVEEAVRPQRTLDFDIPVTSSTSVQTIIDKGDAYANNLQTEIDIHSPWGQRIPLPTSLGYASMRISVHAFSGSGL